MDLNGVTVTVTGNPSSINPANFSALSIQSTTDDLLPGAFVRMTNGGDWLVSRVTISASSKSVFLNGPSQIQRKTVVVPVASSSELIWYVGDNPEESGGEDPVDPGDGPVDPPVPPPVIEP